MSDEHTNPTTGQSNESGLGRRGFLEALVSLPVAGVFFYGFVTPYSFLVRLFASDPLHRATKAEGESYWLHRSEQRARKHFERAF